MIMPRPKHKAPFVIALLLIALLLPLLPQTARAGEIILTNNVGSENNVFIVHNEPSLVINGFDLTPYNLAYPVALDAVTISVNQAVPGATIDLVVYQDANGGSPVDATLAHHQTVSLERAGYNRILLSQPAIISQPVIWVGFYLPVDFRFNADTSGRSVLTYWAWTPGGRFDVRSLANAAVLGPGDGSPPTGLNMDGIARITAELRPPHLGETSGGHIPVGQQFVGEGEPDTSPLEAYAGCGDLLYDSEDIMTTANGAFRMFCYIADEFEAPVSLVQPSGETLDVQRAGRLYKLDGQIPPELETRGATNTLPVKVTHCLNVPSQDLEKAIIAETRGIPERWYVLPSVRYGNLICAEVTTASYLAYFFPRDENSPLNVNLVVGYAQVEPHPLECGLPNFVEVPFVNTGQAWFDTPQTWVYISVENIHVATGRVNGFARYKIQTSQLGPGARRILRIGPIITTWFMNELHRLEVRIDDDNAVNETNEHDNLWATEHVFAPAGGSERCYDTDWLTATPNLNNKNLRKSLDYCFVGQPKAQGNDRVAIPFTKNCTIDFRQGHVEGSAPPEIDDREKFIGQCEDAGFPVGEGLSIEIEDEKRCIEQLMAEWRSSLTRYTKKLKQCWVAVHADVDKQHARVRFRKLSDPVANFPVLDEGTPVPENNSTCQRELKHRIDWENYLLIIREP